MLLGEVVQVYMVPLQEIFGALAAHIPLPNALFEKGGLDGLPSDVWLVRYFLVDVVALVSGR
jgi:hypothetical protein